MKVLVGCEFSGVVRKAFAELGHEAWSCDLLDSEEQSGLHFKCDVRDVLNQGWDLGIFHPPCTYLCVAGNRWHSNNYEKRKEAVEFVETLWNAPIPRVCIENPKSILSTWFHKPTQIIQPYEFGHAEKKLTCLWLRGLPKLKPTNIVPGPYSNRIHMMPGSKNQSRERSRTYTGIARAMASQWGSSQCLATIRNPIDSSKRSSKIAYDQAGSLGVFP